MAIQHKFTKSIRRSLAGVFNRVIFMLWMLPAVHLYADTPLPFSASYEARYGGFRASAERSLERIDDTHIEIRTLLQLKLLGRSVSSIRESSDVFIDSNDGQARSTDYSFIQTGIGKRSRHIQFDWDAAIARASLDNLKLELPLESNATDNLSSYLEIRRQLQEGHQEIIFPGIYKGELEDIHYRVVGEEIADTTLGKFNSIRLKRIREPNSDRNTEIWLAKEWDYMLIKLVQEEPGNSTISLELKEAVMNGTPVTAESPGSQ